MMASYVRYLSDDYWKFTKKAPTVPVAGEFERDRLIRSLPCRMSSADGR